MAFTGNFMCTSFKVELMQAVHNFTATTGNVFKLAMYDNSASFTAATTAYTATNEVTASGSYSAGGGALTNITPTSSGTTAFTDFADLSFTSATITAYGAMIYNVAKVYDPAGAVQAGDVSTVLGSRSVPENIKSYAQKLTTGGTLTPKERDNMKKIIDTLVVERKKMIEPSLGTYRGINKRLGGEDNAINNPFDMVKQPRSLEEILGLRPRGGN